MESQAPSLDVYVPKRYFSMGGILLYIEPKRGVNLYGMGKPAPDAG
jgi:hypothetical protein